MKGEIGMKIKAYAKVNLFLDVTARLENGYHEIATLMQTVSLCDEIEVKKQESGIELFCDIDGLDKKDNIAFLAAERFFENVDGGAGIFLNKKIPKAAGLGGGPADAAAVLYALNSLYGEPYTKDELLQKAKKLGADVPFCLVGGTAFCTGIGEKMTTLEPLENLFVVIAKNGIKKSTGEMYSKIDSLSDRKLLDADGFLEDLKKGEIKKAFEKSGNVFENFYGKEDFSEIKESMLNHNPVYAGLSGAGPSVIAVFEAEKSAQKCFEEIKENQIECYLTRTVAGRKI